MPKCSGRSRSEMPYMTETIKHRSIAVYPVAHLTDEITVQWATYIYRARLHGFNEVFSTMHLPELTLKQQIESIVPIARLAAKHGMEFTVDIGGPFINEILADKQLQELITKVKIDLIRLDYGYTHKQVRELFELLDIKGFVINASMYDREEMEKEIAFFRSLENCELRTCHNFYPRCESGLSQDFALMQNSFIEPHGLVIYYCIPSHTHPRGPLCDGLPSVEYHRYMDITAVTLDLINTYHASGIMLADELFSEEELQHCEAVLNNEPIDIRVETEPAFEKLVLRDHVFRYDSNDCALRSRSSRQMAEFASKVEPFNCVERQPGDITVDNENYKRYSGEVQVVMMPLEADERVNVVGHIDPDELFKLQFYRKGYKYRFVKN